MYPAVFCRIFLLILIRSSHLVSDIVLDPRIPAASSQQHSKSSLSIIYPLCRTHSVRVRLYRSVLVHAWDPAAAAPSVSGETELGPSRYFVIYIDDQRTAIVSLPGVHIFRKTQRSSKDPLWLS